MTAIEHCVCYACGVARVHEPPDCCGCKCDLVDVDEHRVRLKIATIPEPAKDIDELLRTQGDVAYERMLADARHAPAWMIDNIERHPNMAVDLTTAEGKQDAADALEITLSSLPLVERYIYVRQLAERLEIPEDVMRQALNDAFKRRTQREATHPRRNTPEQRSGTRSGPSRTASIDIP